MIQVLNDRRVLSAASQQIREKAVDFTTTLFAAPQLVDAWMVRGKLRYMSGSKTLLLLRRDRDFDHVYHIASAKPDLSVALACLGRAPGPIRVADLVGRADDIAPIVEIYRAQGFQDYVRLIRMVRLDQFSKHGGCASPVDVATASDCLEIEGFLNRLLDPLRDQIPEPEAIEEAAAAGNILMVRSGRTIAGLLFFERTGRTSVLRYWYVDPQFHGRGLGGRLMQTYLRDQHVGGRKILWVADGNSDAIDRYRHYGFDTDGLVDQIMISTGVEEASEDAS